MAEDGEGEDPSGSWLRPTQKLDLRSVPIACSCINWYTEACFMEEQSWTRHDHFTLNFNGTPRSGR